MTVDEGNKKEGREGGKERKGRLVQSIEVQ